MPSSNVTIRTVEADGSPNICTRMLECLFNVAEFWEVPGIIHPPPHPQGLNAFLNIPSGGTVYDHLYICQPRSNALRAGDRHVRPRQSLHVMENGPRALGPRHQSPACAANEFTPSLICGPELNAFPLTSENTQVCFGFYEKK